MVNPTIRGQTGRYLQQSVVRQIAISRASQNMNESTAHVMIMNSYFDFVYAKAMHDQLGSVVRQECYGCQVDHPSQVQHSSVMFEENENIKMYFDHLLTAVSENEFFFSWCEIMDALSICPELLA